MTRTGSCAGRHRARGVEPIVATILMVAVVVVLAAVLYLLVVGLVQTPGKSPIGSAFAAGHPVASLCGAGSSQVLGSTAVTGGCRPGDYVYILTVENSRVALANVLFRVQNPGGSVFDNAGTNGSFALLDATNHVAAVLVTGASLAMAQTWSGYGLTTTAPTYQQASPLATTMVIVIDIGPTSTAGEELEFVAFGTGAYSGSTVPLLLP